MSQTKCIRQVKPGELMEYCQLPMSIPPSEWARIEEFTAGVFGAENLLQLQVELKVSVLAVQNGRVGVMMKQEPSPESELGKALDVTG